MYNGLATLPSQVCMRMYMGEGPTLRHIYAGHGRCHYLFSGPNLPQKLPCVRYYIDVYACMCVRVCVSACVGVCGCVSVVIYERVANPPCIYEGVGHRFYSFLTQGPNPPQKQPYMLYYIYTCLYVSACVCVCVRVGIGQPSV